MSPIERFNMYIQCPFLGGSFIRGSTVCRLYIANNYHNNNYNNDCDTHNLIIILQ